MFLRERGEMMKVVKLYGLLTALGIVVLYVVNLSGFARNTFKTFRTTVLNSSIAFDGKRDADTTILPESNKTEVKLLDPCPRYPSALSK
jgi:hypothetical protein